MCNNSHSASHTLSPSHSSPPSLTRSPSHSFPPSLTLACSHSPSSLPLHISALPPLPLPPPTLPMTVLRTSSRKAPHLIQTIPPSPPPHPPPFPHLPPYPRIFPIPSRVPRPHSPLHPSSLPHIPALAPKPLSFSPLPTRLLINLPPFPAFPPNHLPGPKGNGAEGRVEGAGEEGGGGEAERRGRRTGAGSGSDGEVAEGDREEAGSFCEEADEWGGVGERDGNEGVEVVEEAGKPGEAAEAGEAEDAGEEEEAGR
ncbi:unnamed protein product [Closterium sp. NIES-53]